MGGDHGPPVTVPAALSFFIEDTYARNDAKVAAIEKRFNLKLDMIVTPRAEYDQKLNLAMAARARVDSAQLRRNASATGAPTGVTDTYAADARLWDVDMHYRICGLGSEQEYPT